MFDKLYLHQAKEVLLPRLSQMQTNINVDTSTNFYISALVRDRPVEIRLSSPNKKSVIVDVVDPFGIIRIPRKTFKKLDDFKLFVLTDISKLMDEHLR